MEKRKLIIDCDPGIDDAFAVLAALRSPEFEVLGITSVAGNMKLKTTTHNAAALVTLADKRVYVYAGASNSLDELAKGNTDEREEVHFHGPTGFANVLLKADESLISEQNAVSFIIDCCRKYPSQVEILALGPLTNLALCIRKDKEAMKLAKSITSMGGGIGMANASAYAEYNYYADPRSVAEVLSLAADVPFTMVGLNATHSVMFDSNDLARLSFAHTKIGDFLHEIGMFFTEKYYRSNKYQFPGCVIHDADAFLVLKDESLIKRQVQLKIKVPVEGEHAGETVVDEQGTQIRVIMELDAKRNNELLLSTLLDDRDERKG